jgi:hypothetical protein
VFFPSPPSEPKLFIDTRRYHQEQGVP